MNSHVSSDGFSGQAAVIEQLPHDEVVDRGLVDPLLAKRGVQEGGFAFQGTRSSPASRVPGKPSLVRYSWMSG